MLVFFFSVSWMLIAMGALHTSAYNKFDLLNKLSNEHLIWIVEKMCQMKILIYLPGEWLTTIQIVDKHHFNTFCSYIFFYYSLCVYLHFVSATLFSSASLSTTSPPFFYPISLFFPPHSLSLFVIQFKYCATLCYTKLT